MSSAFAECDAPFGRDACFASDVRFAREKRKTARHFAAKPQYITVCKAICITCDVRRKHHFTYESKLQNTLTTISYIEVSIEENRIPSLRLFESSGFQRIMQEEERITYRCTLFHKKSASGFVKYACGL